MVRRYHANSSRSPPNLPANPLNLLYERIVRTLGPDFVIGRGGPPEDLLDAPVPAPKGAGQENAVLLRRGMLEDDPQLLVCPRLALVALV